MHFLRRNSVLSHFHSAHKFKVGDIALFWYAQPPIISQLDNHFKRNIGYSEELNIAVIATKTFSLAQIKNLKTAQKINLESNFPQQLILSFHCIFHRPLRPVRHIETLQLKELEFSFHFRADYLTVLGL